MRNSKTPSIAFEIARADATEAITVLQRARDVAPKEIRIQIDAAILILRRITD